MSSGPDATLTSLMHQHECLSEPLRTLLLLKLCCCLEWAHATLLPCPKAPREMLQGALLSCNSH